MCELFAFSGRHEENLTPYLIKFFSHSDRNPHGWGIADLHGPVGIEKEPKKANDSRFLPHIIKELLPTDLLMAHIRLGTVGAMNYDNCHPFELSDASGQSWTFMHNGTIFHSDVLGKFQKDQKGTTDSERIFLYIISEINELHDGHPEEASKEEKYSVIERITTELAPGNKLNMMLSDGEDLYIHSNMKGTLYFRPLGSGTLFATVPLDNEEWTLLEQRRLMVFSNGECVYKGTKHEGSYETTDPSKLPWYVPSEDGVEHIDDKLEAAIYHKYILPCERKAGDFVGVELEFPIINMSRGPVDFDVVQGFGIEFANHFHMDHRSFDDDGYMYSAYSSVNGDDLSFDCSYNTLELSFGKERDINIIYERFKKYYTFIQRYLSKYNYMISGLGINPSHDINSNIPVKSERYRMLFHYLSTCEDRSGRRDSLHSYPEFGLFSCSSQVQLDVEKDEIADVLNTFNHLEPMKSVLFANSYLKEEHLLLSRDFLWEKSAHGINPHNTGMYRVDFHNIKEIMNYISSMSIYSMERGGKYINFTPIPIRDYFSKDVITGEFFDGQDYQKIQFVPQLEDLQFVRTFKLDDLTFRGTVEFRSVCTQPVKDVMATAAFHAGLMEEREALMALIDESDEIYGKGYAPAEMRADLNYEVWPSYLEKKDVSAFLLKVLDLAKKGLSKRGNNEEHFLEPLYERAGTLISPALYMKQQLEKGSSMDEIIEEFAEI